ncbi:MAG TPA: tyrosine-type recombinase/integrase [Candidatus Brocadiia bacterium]|nr:tyrosine-type recombinase/integrase [Candidatus Brocadiales bacterium]
MGIYLKGKNWYIDYYVKGRRKRKKVSPSKKLAEQVLKDVHVKIAKGEYLGIYEEKKILFDEYAQQYLDYCKANKAASTYERCARLNVRQLTSAFKGCYLFDITSHMIEKYKAMRLQAVAPATVNRELACIKHMYTKAIEWGYVKLNPGKGVKVLKEPPGRLRYLKPDEVEALLKECPGYIRPIVLTALNTGMRKSEILHLRWAEVDLENRKITVTNTKNNEVRVIPINQTLLRELSALPQNPKSGYVFTNGHGRPFVDIKKGFASALKRAGIEDFRLHDLRHTFGSHLVMQGVDLRTVQQVMGHKEIKMTMRYSHLSPEYVQEAMERLDNVWTPHGHQPKLEKNLISATL